MECFQKAKKATEDQQRKDKAAGIFFFDGSTKRQRRADSIKKLFGEHLIDCCEKGGLFMAFTNAAKRMRETQRLYDAARELGEQGATADEQSEAFGKAEDAYYREEAYAEVSSDEEREALGFAADYNDSITQGVDSCKRGAVQMSLFYMCAKHDPNNYDQSTKCGIYMPGKFWNRKGAEPISTRVWYCGIERSEWEREVQQRLMPEAGGDSGDYDLEVALNSAPSTIGCGCRFRPYSEGSSMVLEVIDRSTENATTMFATRAAIPPKPLSDEIQKVQKGWIKAGRRASAKDLYESIPVIYPKMHIIPGLPVPAIGRFPIKKAIEEDWPEIKEENWYMMALAIASTDVENLSRVYYLCNKKLARDPR